MAMTAKQHTCGGILHLEFKTEVIHPFFPLLAGHIGNADVEIQNQDSN